MIAIEDVLGEIAAPKDVDVTPQARPVQPAFDPIDVVCSQPEASTSKKTWSTGGFELDTSISKLQEERWCGNEENCTSSSEQVAASQFVVQQFTKNSSAASSAALPRVPSTTTSSSSFLEGAASSPSGLSRLIVCVGSEGIQTRTVAIVSCRASCFPARAAPEDDLHAVSRGQKRSFVAEWLCETSWDIDHAQRKTSISFAVVERRI